MKINNTSIRGIYLYDNNTTYEKGDFIIYGDTIYIAQRDIQGVIPSSKDYKVYLSEDVITGDSLEIYQDSPNKLISAQALAKLLTKFMSGFSEKGMIINRIYQDRYDLYLKNSYTKDNTQQLYSDPVDDILSRSDINNAVFVIDSSYDKIIGTVNRYSILRQYTYSEGTILHRIQELISTDTGFIMYREATKLDDGISLFNPDRLEWKAAVNSNISQEVNNLISYYKQKSYDLTVEKSLLRGCFKYKKLDFTEENNSVSITSADIPSIGREDSQILITVIVDKTSDINSHQLFSLTLNLDSGKYILYNNPSLYLEITKSLGTYTLTVPNNISFHSIYYQRTYADFEYERSGKIVEGVEQTVRNEFSELFATPLFSSSSYYVSHVQIPLNKQFLDNDVILVVDTNFKVLSEDTIKRFRFSIDYNSMLDLGIGESVYLYSGYTYSIGLHGSNNGRIEINRVDANKVNISICLTNEAGVRDIAFDISGSILGDEYITSVGWITNVYTQKITEQFPS